MNLLSFTETTWRFSKMSSFSKDNSLCSSSRNAECTSELIPIENALKSRLTFHFFFGWFLNLLVYNNISFSASQDFDIHRQCFHIHEMEKFYKIFNIVFNVIKDWDEKLLLFFSEVETYFKHDKHKKGFTHSFVLPEAVPPEGYHHMNIV